MPRSELRIVALLGLVFVFMCWLWVSTQSQPAQPESDVELLHRLDVMQKQLRELQESAALLARDWALLDAQSAQFGRDGMPDAQDRALRDTSAVAHGALGQTASVRDDIVQPDKKDAQAHPKAAADAALDVVSAKFVTPSAGEVGTGRFRKDGRCGQKYPAADAPEFGECDPNSDADQRGPCCNPHSGWCGNVRVVRWGHCDCIGCVDFSHPDDRRRQAIIRSAILSESAAKAAPATAAPAPAPEQATAVARVAASQSPRWRADGRCGGNYPAKDTPTFGECDPQADGDGVGPCCNPVMGWCGNTRGSDGHCTCADCVDFSVGRNQHTTMCAKAFAVHDPSAWALAEELCRPLFANVNYDDGHHSLLRCRKNLGTNVHYCESRNLFLDTSLIRSGGWAGKHSIRAACYSTLAVVEFNKQPGPRDQVMDITDSLSHQDSLPTDMSCTSFDGKPLILVNPSDDFFSDLYNVYQTILLFLGNVEHPFDMVRLGWLASPSNVHEWTAVFAHGIVLIDRPQCFAHVLLPPRGTRGALKSARSDCALLGNRDCKDFLELLKRHPFISKSSCP